MRLSEEFFYIKIHYVRDKTVVAIETGNKRESHGRVLYLDENVTRMRNAMSNSQVMELELEVGWTPNQIQLRSMTIFNVIVKKKSQGLGFGTIKKNTFSEKIEKLSVNHFHEDEHGHFVGL